MPKQSTSRTTHDIPFAEACEALEEALAGGFRRDVVDDLVRSGEGKEGLARLRLAMSTHTFPTASGAIPGRDRSLRPLVRDLDRRTIKEGFQVLKDWDGRAERFRKDIIPVDMLDYFLRAAWPGDAPEDGVVPGRGTAGGVPLSRAMATLLDYYFLYILALLVLRAWDDGDPNRNLDRVTHLLQLLQGEDGSGYRFLDGAETLLWIAISNYHPDDHAYDRLLEKVRRLEKDQRVRFAAIGAHILGTHLRWGYEAFYQRDLSLLRRDNFADYPWLLFSLSTLMEEYHGMRERGVPAPERRDVVLAILNGITADPPAFAGILPAALADHAEEQSRFSRLYHRYRPDLLEEFEPFRPTAERYSPIAFHFNFPHNAVKAMVGMVLTGWSLPQLPLEGLFREDPGSGAAPESGKDPGSAQVPEPGTDGDTAEPATDGGRGESPEALARALMEHSRANPEQIGPRRVMVMTYMPRTGLRRFRGTVWGEPDPLAEKAPGQAEGNRGAREAMDGVAVRTDRLPGSPFQRGAIVEEEGGAADRS